MAAADYHFTHRGHERSLRAFVTGAISPGQLALALSDAILSRVENPGQDPDMSLTRYSNSSCTFHSPSYSMPFGHFTSTRKRTQSTDSVGIIALII